MHPNNHLAEAVIKATNALREHFDCVSIICSMYEDETNQTPTYCHHKGHIGGCIRDVKTHLEYLEDCDRFLDENPQELEPHENNDED